MNNKDDNNFFSTEDEYNNRVSEQNNSGNEEYSDYSKYLIDDDDGEEFITLPENDDSESDVPEQEEKAKKIDKKKRNKIIKIVLISIIAFIIVGTASVIGYLYFITRGADYGNEGVDYNGDQDIVEEENLDFAAMGDVTDANSLNSYLYNWANNNGEKMHSKNVINVLLCGVDDSDGAKYGRSDSIILVSVNKKTKSITLTSFFRDSYTYMEVPQADGTKKGRYEKINASFVFGGPAALIETIEKNFKIEIDEYISVDFDSFENLIDALGGVTIDVEEHEAKFIRRTSHWTNFPYGKDVTLDGGEALVYSRIRHLDSDINRTERQRKVIKSLIDSAKSASYMQLVNAYRNCAKYIRTGYSQTEVLSLITAAASQNWMDFEMNEITLPSEQGVEMVSTYLNTTSSPGAKQWVWIVDYPICAKKLQLAIYGETNIVLKDNRVSALDFTNAKKITSTQDSSGTGRTTARSSQYGGGYNTTKRSSYSTSVRYSSSHVSSSVPSSSVNSVTQPSSHSSQASSNPVENPNPPADDFENNGND